MGPGIRSAGCSGWFDILLFLASFMSLGGVLVSGLYGMSSCSVDCLSVEKGVLISRTGLFSRCLEMRLNRERGVARVKNRRVLGK